MMDLSMERQCLADGSVSEQALSIGLTHLTMDLGYETTARQIAVGTMPITKAIEFLEKI
jgi:hypothetical protein